MLAQRKVGSAAIVVLTSISVDSSRTELCKKSTSDLAHASGNITHEGEPVLAPMHLSLVMQPDDVIIVLSIPRISADRFVLKRIDVHSNMLIKPSRVIG